MQLIHRILPWSLLLVLLTLGSCQSLLNGGSEDRLYDEVFDGLMINDPLLIHSIASDTSLEARLQNNTLDAQGIQKKTSEVLEIAGKLIAEKSEVNPNLESAIFYLDYTLEKDSFPFHHYPISTTRGIHLDAVRHFSKRKILSRNDIEAYLEDLAGLRQRFGQLIDDLDQRRTNGFFAHPSVLRTARLTCDSVVLTPIAENPMYLNYAEQLNSIGLLDPRKKDEYLSNCKEILLETVIPSYVRLSNYLTQLEETSFSVAGVWSFPNGTAFYTHCLKWHTGLNLSTDSLYNVAKDEMAGFERDANVLKTTEQRISVFPTDDLPKFRKVLRSEAHEQGYHLYLKVEKSADCFSNRLATAKLMVDIGIHQKRWLREQAIEYLMDKVKIPLFEAVTIVDRCISNPGEIGAEKIGQLVIKQLKTNYPEQSVQEFENAITKFGPLPLGVLVRIAKTEVTFRQTNL